jgi:hypothetical protein
MLVGETVRGLAGDFLGSAWCLHRGADPDYRSRSWTRGADGAFRSSLPFTAVRSRPAALLLSLIQQLSELEGFRTRGERSTRRACATRIVRRWLSPRRRKHQLEPDHKRQ